MYTYSTFYILIITSPLFLITSFLNTKLFLIKDLQVRSESFQISSNIFVGNQFYFETSLQPLAFNVAGRLDSLPSLRII